MEEVQTKNYKTNRILYIIEAALEYFISLGVGTTYLPKICEVIGISETTTALLIGLIPFGNTFQLFSILVADKRPVKNWVTVLHIVSQIFFSVIWFTPFFKGSVLLNTVFFIGVLFSAYIIHNIINSPKISWYMSFVDDHKRGSFTAVKEIVSLVSGMLFSLLFGYIVDLLEKPEMGKLPFAIAGGVMLGITVLHTLSLIFTTKEEVIDKKSKEIALKRILKNKKVLLANLLAVGHMLAIYFVTPFVAATYQYKVLGLSVFAVSLITAVSSLARALVARPLGKLGDKKSFAFLLNVCYVMLILAILVLVVMLPSFDSGKIVIEGIGSLYAFAILFLYNLFYAIAMGGINSGEMNIVYDFVEKEDRTSAYAILKTTSGLAGSFATVLATALATVFQDKEMFVFGQRIYFIQIGGVICIALMLGVILFNKLVVEKLKKAEEN